MPTLEAQKISIEPSPFSLIGLAFGSSPTSIRASVQAQGFMGGNVSISHKPNGSSDEGAQKNHISVNAESVQLGEIEKFVDSPVQLRGKANLATEFDFFPAFDGQPEGDLKLTTKELKILAGSIPTQFFGRFLCPASIGRRSPSKRAWEARRLILTKSTWVQRVMRCRAGSKGK